MEIETQILDNRIIILNGEINNRTSNDLIQKLIYLDSLNNDDIYLYINSCGGDVYQGLAIIDCMEYIKSKVITIVIGVAYSMAAIILSTGEKRYALPHSEIMIHQPLGNASGKASEIISSSKRIGEIKVLLADIIKQKSNKTLKKIITDMEKDYFLSPEQAKNYGIIDKVITKRSAN